MWHRWARSLTVVAMVFATIGLSTGPARAERLLLVADPWCPYNCDPAVGREGYMLEVARAVFEPLGYEVEYQVVTWSLAIHMVEQGDAAAIVGAGLEDVDGVFPGLPLGSSANGILTRRGYPFIWDGTGSLEAHRLAVIKDYSYGELIDAYVEANAENPARLTVLSGFGYNQLVQSLRSMMAGQVDLVVDDRNVLAWMSARLGLVDRTDMHPIDDAEPVFIAFSPRNPDAQELARHLDEGMRRLRGDGTLARMLQSYGLKDWEDGQGR